MHHLRYRDTRTTTRIRISAGILLASLACFLLIGALIYRNIKSDFISKCQATVMDIASIVSDEINGDDFEKISSAGDQEYSELFLLLSKYEKAGSVEYAYTMRYVSEDTLMFVVDADPDPESRAPYGEEYMFIDDMHPAFEGKVCCDTKISSDRWGSYFSAYAPIVTSDGRVAGMVGVDSDISEVFSKLNRIKFNIALQISVFFVICFIIMLNLISSFSRRDQLTGIMNYDSIVAYGNKLSRKGVLCRYTAIQMNIRNFKYINSRIGTSRGDILLKKYAKLISSIVSGSGFCARMGSDNFMVLTEKGKEEEIIEKLSESWISMKEYGVEDDIQISLRCGIYSIKKSDSIQDVMNYTSVALKNSRISGNNYIVRFEESMLSTMVHNTKIISEFRTALESKEFRVFYQPKVNVETNNLCGAEALVRWVKDGKVISPSDFIPVLESEGNITELDFFVFETVCRNISEWIEKGIRPVTISSNFSKLHLADPGFADKILETVKKYGVPHDLIEIELTESSGYSNFDALTFFVGRMNSEYIHTSIDDFGTGYSSLSMLRSINVDVVKIDKSFLAKPDSDDTHQKKLLENVIRMINDLDRTVICEGIETRSQLEFIKNADCSVVQGYFFDKPLEHDEFEKRLISPHYKIS